jgi:hypothetical protein
MKISDDGMRQPNAKDVFGFAHLLSAQDFAQRGLVEIVLAGDKLINRAGRSPTFAGIALAVRPR